MRKRERGAKESQNNRHREQSSEPTDSDWQLTVWPGTSAWLGSAGSGLVCPGTCIRYPWWQPACLPAHSSCSCCCCHKDKENLLTIKGKTECENLSHSAAAAAAANVKWATFKKGTTTRVLSGKLRLTWEAQDEPHWNSRRMTRLWRFLQL